MQSPSETPPTRHRWLAIPYWLLTGAVLGVGVIAILGIGLLLLLLGLGLLVFGVLRIGARGLWATIVGFGAAPALILQYDVATAPPLCSGVSHVGMVCGGPTDAYQTLALVFAAIAVFGILIGLGLALIRLWHRPHRPATAAY